jgi:hypothetical protein
MSVELWIALAANVTSLLVAAGGWLFAWRLQNEKKKQEQRDKLLERSLREILVRIALEEQILDFAAEQLPMKKKAIQNLLRDRVEAELGYRPAMSRSQVKQLIERNAG